MVSSFYVNPTEPKLIETTNNSFCFHARPAGTIGGVSTVKKIESLRNDPFETGKTGYVRVSNGYLSNNLKAMIDDLEGKKVNYTHNAKDESECRHRYKMNTSYASTDGREKKNLYS